MVARIFLQNNPQRAKYENIFITLDSFSYGLIHTKVHSIARQSFYRIMDLFLMCDNHALSMCFPLQDVVSFCLTWQLRATTPRTAILFAFTSTSTNWGGPCCFSRWHFLKTLTADEGETFVLLFPCVTIPQGHRGGIMPLRKRGEKNNINAWT